MASEAKSLGFGELEDLDSLNAFLIAMWTVIKEEWADLFVANSKLLSKVGIAAPIQTPPMRLGVKPTNQPSEWFWVVPVLPARSTL